MLSPTSTAARRDCSLWQLPRWCAPRTGPANFHSACVWQRACPSAPLCNAAAAHAAGTLLPGPALLPGTRHLRVPSCRAPGRALGRRGYSPIISRVFVVGTLRPSQRVIEGDVGSLQRVIDLIKQLPAIHGGCRVAKLFSKHIKVEEQARPLLPARPPPALCESACSVSRRDRKSVV